MTPPGKSDLSSPEVRDALEADMAAVRDLYGHYVLHDGHSRDFVILYPERAPNFPVAAPVST
jgi:hypothetical protein